MRYQIAYLVISAFCVVLVFTSGWLGSPHNRLAGILGLVIAVAAAYMAVRPRRQ